MGLCSLLQGVGGAVDPSLVCMLVSAHSSIVKDACDTGLKNLGGRERHVPGCLSPPVEGCLRAGPRGVLAGTVNAILLQTGCLATFGSMGSSGWWTSPHLPLPQSTMRINCSDLTSD